MKKALYSAGLVLAATAMPATASYTEISDVIYGQGTITSNGELAQKDLWMDVFLPDGKADEAVPAVVMMHGGSFLRGHPREPYLIDGAQSTPMNEYCEQFAKQGYACFSISYRLGADEPVPSWNGYDRDDLKPETVFGIIPQANVVRNLMGLPIIDPNVPEDFAKMENSVLAAAEDMRTAVNHIRDNSQEYGVNPEKVVLGGFSAGAITSLNVGYAMEDVDVSGVFLLSGAQVGFDVLSKVDKDSAPLLLFMGQWDFAPGFPLIGELHEHYLEHDADLELAWVPNFGHFYPRGAVSLAGDAYRLSVEQRVMNFVERVTK
jgi:acetyl esterase/lipase